jgi:hypothetical protein
LQVERLVIEKTKKPKTIPPLQSLVFGRTFSDHMFEIDWNAKDGWQVPKIIPYGPLVLDPSCMVFHYASEVEEIPSKGPFLQQKEMEFLFFFCVSSHFDETQSTAVVRRSQSIQGQARRHSTLSSRNEC